MQWCCGSGTALVMTAGLMVSWCTVLSEISDPLIVIMFCTDIHGIHRMKPGGFFWCHHEVDRFLFYY